MIRISDNGHMAKGRKKCHLKPKKKIKRRIDFLMTVMLLLLMAYQITGQELHEWFGVGMFVLMSIHLGFHWSKILGMFLLYAP